MFTQRLKELNLPVIKIIKDLYKSKKKIKQAKEAFYPAFRGEVTLAEKWVKDLTVYFKKELNEDFTKYLEPNLVQRGFKIK